MAEAAFRGLSSGRHHRVDCAPCNVAAAGWRSHRGTRRSSCRWAGAGSSPVRRHSIASSPASTRSMRPRRCASISTPSKCSTRSAPGWCCAPAGASRDAASALPDFAEIVRAALEFVGVETLEFLRGARELLGFFGLVCVAVARAFREPNRLRTVPVVAQMQRAGVAALPIVGLLSFLIGIVLTFQGADQLRRFGAEIFAVDLLGLGVLREL